MIDVEGIVIIVNTKSDYSLKNGANLHLDSRCRYYEQGEVLGPRLFCSFFMTFFIAFVY